jgi:hypothetical protein
LIFFFSGYIQTFGKLPRKVKKSNFGLLVQSEYQTKKWVSGFCQRGECGKFHPQKYGDGFIPPIFF